MNRILKERILVTLVATIMAAVLGTLAGYVLGRAVSLHLALRKLWQDSSRMIAISEMYSKEARSTLAQMDAAQLPFCSDSEMAFVRTLVFQSHYLKDGGHIIDGRIACSATLSSVNLPKGRLKPDFSQPDGTLVYRDHSPILIGNLQSVVVQLGSSYVVYTPHILDFLHVTTSRFILTSPFAPSIMVNSENGTDQARTKQARINQAISQEGPARVDDTYYATRCSARYFKCGSTDISIPEALRDQIRRFVREEVIPHGEAWEEAGMVPRDVLRRMGEFGFLGIRFPAEYGGQMSAVIDLNNRVPTGAFHLDASTYAGSYLVFNGTRPFSPGKELQSGPSSSVPSDTLGGRVGPFRALNSNGQSLSASDHIGKLGFYVSGSRQETDRRIDTPIPRLFHDHGFDYFLYGKFDYILSDIDYLTCNLNFGKTNTQVPYDPSQPVASDLQETSNSFQAVSYFRSLSSEIDQESNLFIGGYDRQGGLQYTPGDIDPPTFQFVDYPGRNCLLGEDRSFNTVGVGSTSDDRLSHEWPEGVDDVQLLKKFAIARQQA